MHAAITPCAPSATSGSVRHMREAIAVSESFTSQNTAKSSSAATTRIQKPAGRVVITLVIITAMISVRDGQNRILDRVTSIAPPELVAVVDALRSEERR